MRVIGLIATKDQQAFGIYREQVTATIEKHGGQIRFRGASPVTFWNELNTPDIDSIVEIDFPSQAAAESWAQSPDYQALLSIRSQSMRLTLIGFHSL